MRRLIILCLLSAVASSPQTLITNLTLILVVGIVSILCKIKLFLIHLLTIALFFGGVIVVLCYLRSITPSSPSFSKWWHLTLAILIVYIQVRRERGSSVGRDATINITVRLSTLGDPIVTIFILYVTYAFHLILNILSNSSGPLTKHK